MKRLSNKKMTTNTGTYSPLNILTEKEESSGASPRHIVDFADLKKPATEKVGELTQEPLPSSAPKVDSPTE